MPMPTPAANNIQVQDINPNSGIERSPPSLIFPNGDMIKKIITKIKEDIETVNKVSNQFNTKFLVSESNSVEGSGKIKTKLEKRIVKPEVNRKTGKCTSSPRNLTLLSLS